MRFEPECETKRSKATLSDLTPGPMATFSHTKGQEGVRFALAFALPYKTSIRSRAEACAPFLLTPPRTRDTVKHRSESLYTATQIPHERKGLDDRRCRHWRPSRAGCRTC